MGLCVELKLCFRMDRLLECLEIVQIGAELMLMYLLILIIDLIVGLLDRELDHQVQLASV